jgi:hypothetical protein
VAYTSPYKQQNYMGEFASDAAANTAILQRQFDTNKNGTGTPEEGMLYYNFVDKSFRFYNGVFWVVWETPPYLSYDGVFYFNSVSPFVIMSLLPGELIDEAEIKITTVFDDPSATLQLGTPATPNLLFGVNEIDPNRLAQFGSEDNIEILVPETLQLLIVPGVSTQGQGSYHVRVKKA